MKDYILRSVFSIPAKTKQLTSLRACAGVVTLNKIANFRMTMYQNRTQITRIHILRYFAHYLF